MANDLTNIMHKILARGLLSLRERVIFTQLVNTDYSREAAMKGQTIDVPIPTAINVIDVTPSNTDPAPTDDTPGLVQISLDKWKQNEPFFLTDKELVEVDRNEHFLPLQVGESIRALVRSMNQSVIDEYKGVYGYVGTAGTTPFQSSVEAITQARKVLNQQLAPPMDRRVVLDHVAEANALALSPLADFDRTGDANVKRAGMLGQKYGFDWYADDDVPTHTAGTATTKTVTLTSDSAAGATSVTLDVDSGTGTLVEGDIISFAGHDQTYVVTADVTLTTGGDAVSISPGLSQAVDGSGTPVAVTVRGDHVVNLAFQRDALALATRPLSRSTIVGDGANTAEISDPLTGLVLRLEVRRQHKQVAWEFDALWGVKLVRPELACRIAG